MDDERPRRGDKRERTREALIEATLAVVAEKGFAAASLDEIAARAGMTKGAIYSNFQGKAHLLTAARRSKALGLDPWFEPGANLAEVIREMGEALIRLLPRAQGEAAFIAEFNLYALADPELGRRMADLYSRQFAASAEVTARVFPGQLAIDNRAFAVVVQSLALGLLYQSFLTPDEVTEETVRAAFAAMARGVAA